MNRDLIDVHHHARPKAFFEALAETGRSTMGGRPLPAGWTMPEALAVMDEAGIQTALLSAPDADMIYRDRAIALRLSRVMNDLFAECTLAYPTRFGGFASLPMPHLDEALGEVAHALDQLKLDGVMLSTSYDGCYLGSPQLDPLLSELNRRETVVFVHPVSPLGASTFQLDFPASLLEYTFDTTRCVANLCRHQVPKRFPGIKFIFAHAGGAAPYLLSRLSLMPSFVPPYPDLDVEQHLDDVRRALQTLHYDLALSSTDAVLALLRDTVGTKQILFGSDYPQATAEFFQPMAQQLRTSKSLDEQARNDIVRDNGLKLFKRLGEARTQRTSADPADTRILAPETI